MPYLGEDDLEVFEDDEGLLETEKVNAIDATLKKGQQQAQQRSIMPLLLTKPPQIESFTKVGDDEPVSVQTTTYKKDDSAIRASAGSLLVNQTTGAGYAPFGFGCNLSLS